MAHDYCICGADRVSCIDCAEAAIERLTAQLAEAKQELTEKDKQLFEENLQVKRLESQLSHYQGGVEVKGVVEFYPGTKIAGVFVHQKMPDEMVGEQVRVLVMPVQEKL